MAELNNSPENEADLDDRRKFLATCGRFAVITPPTITMLLSTSLTSNAVTHSNAGAAHVDNGFGTGGNDSSPNDKFTDQSTVR